MATTQQIFGRIAKRMQQPCRIDSATVGTSEAPGIPDLIRRIDRALLERRAA